VSRWFTVDWVGWKLVEWDLENDTVGSWLGNGRLEGLLRFDSFQMRYLPGLGTRAGGLYFDQLQLAVKTPTAVDEQRGELPKEITLHQNYPNPFNPSTIISFSLPRTERVTLKVFNSIGQEIATLVNAELDAGNHRAAFNASKLASGLYIYRLETGNFVSVKKMMLMK
jgi:hypothetical protein